MRVPIVSGHVSCFTKLTTRLASSAGIASVAVSMVATTGWRRDVRIALGGIDRDAQRASEAESVLESSVMDDSVLARAAAIAASQAKTSLVGGGQDRYRRRVLAALTMRALASLEHTR